MNDQHYGKTHAAPAVTILKPEAGAIWIGAHTIKYEAESPEGCVLSVRLEYRLAGDDAGWQLIADSQDNTGTYLWDTSKLAKGGLCTVRVGVDSSDGRVAQASSDEFSVVVLERIVAADLDPARGAVRFYHGMEADAVICVYDSVGRSVHNAELPAGTNVHEWDMTMHGRPVAAGLYSYAIVSCDGCQSGAGQIIIDGR